MTPSSPEKPTRPAAPPPQHASTDPAAATPPRQPPVSSSRRSGFARRWLLLFTVTGLALLLIAGCAGYRLGSASRTPTEGSADVGFARDMQTHHAQAVQMAMVIRDKTSDPTLRAVADDITTSQQHQTGQMYAWLVQWGLPQTGDNPPMTWTSEGTHEGTGHNPTGTPTLPPSATTPAAPTTNPQTPLAGMGMATGEQIHSLQQATGADAERLFLQLMITHHQGGVTMAKAALQRADRPEVRTLAAAIHTAQSAEIDQLQQLLQQRQ